MSDHLNILLVGAGPMAVAYAQVLAAQGRRFEVVGRGAASAARFAAQTGITPRQGGLAACLASLDPGQPIAAIVALPVTQLAAATKLLLAFGAGRILVEKPGGLDAVEVASVATAAEIAGRQVFVGYNRRFYASSLRAARIVAEEGGPTSFTFEFSEVESRVLSQPQAPEVLRAWFLANSSHVLDLAFHLGGAPAALHAAVSGALDWHPRGAVFVGHGRTTGGALFSWHADWMSAGRWRIDIRTRARALLLEPLETLKQRAKGSFGWEDVALDDALDRAFKPGLHRQVEAFLGPDPARDGLPTIGAQHAAILSRFLPIASPS